jgi:hypothetical protein
MPTKILQLLNSGDAIIIPGAGNVPFPTSLHERTGAGRGNSDDARTALRELIALRTQGKRK